MPEVTMTRQISGTRNGQPWPSPGETVDVSASEAEGLVNLGLAAVDADKPAPQRQETRTVEPTKQATKNPRKPKD